MKLILHRAGRVRERLKGGGKAESEVVGEERGREKERGKEREFVCNAKSRCTSGDRE